MTIEIHNLSSDDAGEPVDELIGRCSVAEDGKVVIAADARTSAFLRRFVTVAPDRRRFTIEDGKPWLDNLPRSLAGTYVWAQGSPT